MTLTDQVLHTFDVAARTSGEAGLSVWLTCPAPDGPYEPFNQLFTRPEWVLTAGQQKTCTLTLHGEQIRLKAHWRAVAEYLRTLTGHWLAGYLSYSLAEQQILGPDPRPADALPVIGGFRSPSDQVPEPDARASAFRLSAPFQPLWERPDYVAAFERVQHYILAGDCYQINLTQALQAPYQGDPLTLFRALVGRFRAPFSGYVQFNGQAVLSFSPERFLRIEKDQVETRPIKGTRPRRADPLADHQEARALLASEKDRAENLMIVDLLRNDLGRFCVPGSIRVPALFALERYSNVHHLVSTVTGTLREAVTPLAVLEGCSPGGSITGAPKIRAMQIIRELEPLPRGVYCGSLFYLSPEGVLDSSIAIRTLTTDGRHIRVWGGGGVVADSAADPEFEESMTKIRHLIEAIEAFGTGAA